MGNPHSLDNVNCHLEEEDEKEEKEAERAVRPMEGEKGDILLMQRCSLVC